MFTPTNPPKPRSKPSSKVIDVNCYSKCILKVLNENLIKFTSTKMQLEICILCIKN